MSTAILKTDIAWIEVGGDDETITRLLWHSKKPAETEPTPLLREAARQVEAYIAGRLQQFDLPLRAEGSDLAKSVWGEMLAIPYGRTRTYGDVARLRHPRCWRPNTRCLPDRSPRSAPIRSDRDSRID